VVLVLATGPFDESLSSFLNFIISYIYKLHAARVSHTTSALHQNTKGMQAYHFETPAPPPPPSFPSLVLEQRVHALVDLGVPERRQRQLVLDPSSLCSGSGVKVSRRERRIGTQTSAQLAPSS